jgi:uncharacterized protein
MPLNEEDRRTLLQIARQTLEYGVKTGDLMPMDLKSYPAHLLEERATFVTLKLHGKLRGCVGMIQAVQPLVVDVAHSAYAAAFRDRRFLPLKPAELKDLDIHISILTPLEEIEFTSEEDLLEKLRPGLDGLTLEDRMYRGAFLPVMWEELPDRREFLAHLKIKAGLSPQYWSDTIRVFRFTAEMIK